MSVNGSGFGPGSEPVGRPDPVLVFVTASLARVVVCVGQVINPVDYHLNDMISSAAAKYAGKGVFNHAFSSAVSMFLAKFIAQTNAAQVLHVFCFCFCFCLFVFFL